MVVVAVVRPDFLAFADDAQSMGVPLGGQILVMPMSSTTCAGDRGTRRGRRRDRR